MLNSLGLHFFSVCDGHGSDGHHVSQYIKEFMPSCIQQLLLKDPDFYKDSKISYLYDRIPYLLEEAFLKTHQDLSKQPFDSEMSGSTCVSLLIDRNNVFCANAGDSRAVLFSMNAEEHYITPMSIDHKPCMEVETKRILAKGGRIDNIRGNCG